MGVVYTQAHRSREMAAKSSRLVTFSGDADENKANNDTLVTRYSSYDDSDIRSSSGDVARVSHNLDTTFLLEPEDVMEKDGPSIVRRSLSQRISSSLSVKLPARLRSRAHALGRRRTSTKIDDSFIALSKNTPQYVMTMDSNNIIE